MEQEALASSRSRRTKKDKSGRLSALEKFRSLKAEGRKNKLEKLEDDAVYEEVDEKEYSKIVRNRQEDDWIVDDDGSGYVEDGREIFDDGYEEDESQSKGGSKGRGKAATKAKRLDPNIRPHDSKPKNIRSMFAAAAAKPKSKPEDDSNALDIEEMVDLTSNIRSMFAKPSAQSPKPQVEKVLRKTTPTLRPVHARPSVTPITSMKSAPTPEVFPRKSSETITKTVVDKKPALNNNEDMETVVDTVNPADEDVSFLLEDGEMEEEMLLEQKSEEVKHAEPNQMDTTEMKPSQYSMTWESVNASFSEGQSGVDQLQAADVQVDTSHLPLVTSDTGQQVLRVFWFDAYEDQYKQPGVVYLFGKVYVPSVKNHISCSVAVKNIERRVYLLPRKTKKDSPDTPVSFTDVYKEFDQVAASHKIMKFRCIKVERKYVFEKVDVPVEAEYMEVRYSADFPVLPDDLQGDTFSHIFGVHTSSLELLVLGRKLKGPSWIDIVNPLVPKVSVTWCKLEVILDQMDHLTVTVNPPPQPPLVLMTFTLRTLPSKDHHNEVISVAGLIHNEFYLDRPTPKPLFQHHFSVVSKPSQAVYPFDFKDKVQQQNTMKVEMCGNERGLLSLLLAKINKADPDIIVGHDLFGFDLDVLLHRISTTKVPQWSRLGRLKRSAMPRLGGFGSAKTSAAGQACSGRLVCDLKVSAKELLHCRSYDLSELCAQVLKEARQELDAEHILACYNESRQLLTMLEWALLDCNMILRLCSELSVLQLAAQITSICGNVMSRTLMGGRAERNEYLLLHAFTEKNYIPPEKLVHKKAQPIATLNIDADDLEVEPSTQTAGGKQTSSRRKPAYAGGLVLEPKKGFYDTFILLLDFNSLYPSIIQEYNICFTTVIRTEEDTEIENIETSGLEPGVLPTEIRKLVQSRREVKKMMKEKGLSHEIYTQYDIRQKALKLTANSMYGCLGFSFSRFYAKPLAALITSKGREILLKTKEMVEGMNLDVIYGDTDSIMINTNSRNLDEVYKLGNKIKNEVNKLYRTLEIEVDGVFQSMLLLKKKKYAALAMTTDASGKVTTSQELKGLDIVRRDWCELAKKAGNYVISQLLSGESRDTVLENIHAHLIQLGEDVRSAKVPMELYYITKQLTKNPEDYPDNKSLPHVQVAIRLNSKGGRKLRAGDTVYYLICKDGSTLSASQRAYHPDEFVRSDTLSVDTHYYLANQVHPVVSRLCEPIEGTDAARIAECLGLDPSGYRHTIRSQREEEDDALLGGAGVSDAEKFKDCQPFCYPCQTCEMDMYITTVFRNTGNNNWSFSMANCPTCGANLLYDQTGGESTGQQWLKRITNHLTMAVRNYIKQYYMGWMRCEDSACGTRQRQMPLEFHRGLPVCPGCLKSVMHAEYTEQALYLQLCFLQHLFDVERALNQLKDSRDIDVCRMASKVLLTHYQQIKTHMDAILKKSAYSEVNLTKLFGGMFG